MPLKSLDPRILVPLVLACSSNPPVDEDSATGSQAGTTSLPTPTTGGETDTTGSPPATTGDTTTGTSTSSTTDAPTSTQATDTATSSTTGDTTTGVLPCEGDSESTLPGVRICFPPQQTSFTLAEAQAGVEFQYDVIVDADLDDLQPEPGDGGSCDEPDASGLYTLGRVEGADDSYCVCDVGLCPCCDFPVITLLAGTYPDTFAWNGVNWGGPSDTNTPFGPPFPPGDYTVTITAKGLWSPRGVENVFVVQGTLPITLVR